VNSVMVRRFIKSYSSGGRGFGAPSVMEHLGITKYDKNNTAHKRLSELSKVLHRLREKEKEEEIKKREKELEKEVGKLFVLRENK
jgi:hypothetical protein